MEKNENKHNPSICVDILHFIHITYIYMTYIVKCVNCVDKMVRTNLTETQQLKLSTTKKKSDMYTYTQSG